MLIELEVIVGGAYRRLKAIIDEPSITRARDYFEPNIYNAYIELSQLADTYKDWQDDPSRISPDHGFYRAFYRYPLLDDLGQTTRNLELMITDFDAQIGSARTS
ncbi:hypothetical protein HB774_02225 [Rhizobium leguminosarum bv. viciae]|nr:hypothetical protein HB774_02225 [Rhizobium leguminosarum bv. viciae]